MYAHILAPLKQDVSDDAVLHHAVGLCKLAGADLILVHVVHSHSRDEETYLRGRAEAYLQTMAGYAQAEGIQTRTRVVLAEPAPGIARAAEEVGADLIIMATHAHREMRHVFVGSVTEDVIRESKVPVLLVRPPGV